MAIKIILFFLIIHSVYSDSNISECKINLYSDSFLIQTNRFNLVGEDIKSVQNSIRYKKLFKKMKSIEEINTDAKLMLNLLNITYKSATIEGEKAYLLSGKNTDNLAFSKFISSIRQKLGTKIYVSNALAKKLEGSAYYQPKFNRIVIPEEHLLELTTNPYFYHELRHAYQESMFVKNMDSLFFGELEANQNKIISNYTKEYQKYMSIDELSSFAYDLRITSSLLKRKMAQTLSVSQEIELLKNSSKSLINIIKQTRLAFDSSKRMVQTTPRAVEFEVIQKNSNSMKVLNVYIKNNDYTLLLQFNSKSALSKYEAFKETRNTALLTKLILNRIENILSFANDLEIPLEQLFNVSSKQTITTDEIQNLIQLARKPRSIVLKHELTN